MKMDQNKHFYNVEIKTLNKDEGKITGYLNTWNMDLYGDVMQKGAFKETINKLKKEKKKIPLLVEHDMGRVAGYWDTDSLKEDSKGLYGEAYFNLETQEGREAYSNAKMLDTSYGLSIGFFAMDYGYNKDGLRELKEVDLFETSLVVLPANQESGIKEVKSVRDIEKGLRDLGYSRKQAKSIISEYKQDDIEEPDSLVEAVDTINSLNTSELKAVKSLIDEKLKPESNDEYKTALELLNVQMKLIK